MTTNQWFGIVIFLLFLFSYLYVSIYKRKYINVLNWFILILSLLALVAALIWTQGFLNGIISSLICLPFIFPIIYGRLFLRDKIGTQMWNSIVRSVERPSRIALKKRSKEK